MTEIVTGIVLFCLVILVIGVRAILRNEAKGRDGHGPAQAEDQDGYHVLSSGYMAGGPGGGHTATWRVPKNSQAYTRAMMPRKGDTDDD